MAVELKFTPKIDLANELFTLTDATGNYESLLNPGGYGAPNPDRSTLALFVLLQDIYDQALPVEIAPQSYNEETLTSFNFDLDKTKDRVMRGVVFAVPEETGAEIVGNVYFNTVANEIRKKTGAGYDVLTVSGLDAEGVVKTEYHYYVANYLQDTLRNKVQRDLYYYRSNASECDDTHIAKLEEQKRALEEFYDGGKEALEETKYDRLSRIIDGTKIYIESYVDLS